MIGGPIVPKCFYSVADNLTAIAGNVMTFPITRTGDCKDNAEIYYSFTNGTAIQNQHFSSSANHVQFSPASATIANIYVNTVSGASSTPVEFTVNIVENNDNDSIVDSSATGRISPPPVVDPCVFYPGNAQGSAGNSLTFNFYRSGSCASDQTVQFSTSNEDAIAGTHYVANSGNVTFAGNNSTTSVSVTTISGSVNYGDPRYFRLNVSSSNPAIQPKYPSSPYARGKIYAPGDD